MLKKSLITISIFCILALVCSPVFASNLVKGAEDALNNIKGGVQNMANDAGNTMERAKDGISNVAEDMKNGASNMGRNVEGAIKDGSRDGENTGFATNGGYTATRTSASDVTGNNTFNKALVWVVLGVTGAIIIALVWYYGTQTSSRDNY